MHVNNDPHRSFRLGFRLLSGVPRASARTAAGGEDLIDSHFCEIGTLPCCKCILFGRIGVKLRNVASVSRFALELDLVDLLFNEANSVLNGDFEVKFTIFSVKYVFKKMPF